MTSRANRATLVATTAALISAGLVAGCATKAPDYQRPETGPPAQFRFQEAAAQPAPFGDRSLGSAFNDPALTALIDEALKSNNDIKVAIARIEQARAEVAAVQSQSRPQTGYQIGGGGQNTFVPTRTSVDTVSYGSLGGALNMAWEFDVWGRIRHSTEAAQARLLSQEDVRRGVMLTLVTDIAAGYFRLLELDRQQAIAEEAAETYKRTADLFGKRFEAGRDSRLPVDRSEGLYRDALAQVEDIKRQIGQQENALSVLAGGYPRAIPRGLALTQQRLPPTPLSETTALLERRPDILAAEQTMKSANAEIGVAVANYYPRIGLSALVGVLGADVRDSFRGFGLWSLALGAAGPITTGGRLDAIYHQRQAFWDETVAQYRQTVLVAFRETSDSLVAQQRLEVRRAALEAEVAALQRSSDLAMRRYDAGRASYFEVLETQRQLFPAEEALAQARGDQLVAVVSLYKALGGGWNQVPEPATQARSDASPSPSGAPHVQGVQGR